MSKERFSCKDRKLHMDRPFYKRKYLRKDEIRKSRRYDTSLVFFICDVDGTEFEGQFCPKCGLQAKDWKKFHMI